MADSITLVREATLDECAAVFCLASEFPGRDKVVRKDFERMFARITEDPKSVILIHGRSPALNGYLLGSSRYVFHRSGPAASIDELLVVNHQRGKGVGSALVAAFESWGAAQGCCQVALATAGAPLFYIRIGYSRTADYLKKRLLPEPAQGIADSGGRE